METRHPVEKPFGSEFSAICNRFVVMAAWTEVERRWHFVRNCCVFLEKRPLTVKFSKLCYESFYRDTDRRCCAKIWWNVAYGSREIDEIVRYLPDKKKISPASQIVPTVRIEPKIYQSQPQQYTQSAPDFIQIGSLSTKLAERVKWTSPNRLVK